jgi:pimeloyl-ACP methyl ester carboxylesterase
VVREDLAERGGAALAQAVDGLRASRAGDPAHVTVIGHSYGSTTAGHAAHDQGLAADDLVFVGSPGLGGGVDGPADLGMSSQHVWAGANSHDVVPDLADQGSIDLGLLGGIGLGNDPAEDDFGAIRFQAESASGSDPDAHSSYFEDGSESLDNLAHIVTGQYGLVDQAPGVTDPWWGPTMDPESGRIPRPGPGLAA